MMNKGFTLFIAIVVMGTLLLVASGIISLAFKESLISSSGKESQLAFYAADTGMECALYWDIRNPSGQSAFATSTGSTINCNKDANNPGNEWVVGGAQTSGFQINFNPDKFCATVRVTKSMDSSNWTKIEAFGYNNCAGGARAVVQRAIKAEY
jgi:hypothetical protein